MFKNLLLALLCLLPLWGNAQLNLTLKSHVPFPQRLSDIWGYSANGREYALIGTQTGLSIYDITDTENPVDKGFIPGPESIWRDIKVWDHYAYVTNETGGGLNVVNLENVETGVTAADAFRWQPDLPDIGGVLEPCHNIYIDENGVGYLSGCNLNNGGVFFIDLFTDPGTPAYIAAAPPIYSHDAYVRDNIMYSSDIYQGHLSIYDVNDLNDVQLLATQQTPFNFTHNAWLSDDSQTVFTTDEVADAPVAAYDISNLDDIREVDQFRPIATINEGVLPHNVFVWEDWLIISYYTDGCILADGSRPDNIIEVGNFDTVLPDGGSGAWGVYPYYESQTIVVSDIEQGFFVLEPNFVRACWLEGRITNAVTGAPVHEAVVEIASSQANLTSSELDGIYKTGQAIPGTFDVAIAHPAYYPKTVTGVMLENGEVTLLDVELDPLPTANMNIQIVNAETNEPLNNAIIKMEGQGLTLHFDTDAGGNAESLIVAGGYAVTVTKWGFHEKIANINPQNGETIVIGLTPGYKDDFLTDQNWEVASSANQGIWERARPVGTQVGGNFYNPNADVQGDLGSECYVTGNSGVQVGDDDVDNGFTRLTSPPMDLTTYANPVISYDIWFANNFGGGMANDHVDVKIDNGITEVLLERIEDNLNAWIPRSFVVEDFITITDEMVLIVEATDIPDGHVVEAGFDRFLVSDSGAAQPFTISNAAGCAPVSVFFTDQNDDASTWNWTFEGGNITTSNDQQPTVSFSQSGDYDVSLTTTTSNGTFTFNQIVNVVIYETPIADFTYTELDNNQVIFNNQSSDAISYQWDFGDGHTSSLPSPIHTYDAEGTYFVSLTVTNPCGFVVTSKAVTLGTVSTQQFSDNLFNWNVFPNPFKGGFTIDFAYGTAFESAAVEVFSVTGQLVHRQAVADGRNRIELNADVAKGIYIVRMIVDGAVVVVDKVVGE